MIRTLAMACFFVLGAASVNADILTLKDGTKVEGTILDENDKAYVVDTGLETVEYPLADVTSVEKKRFNARTVKKDEFKKREDAVSENDVEGLMTLALWANEQGLKIDYKKVLRKVIAADTDHKKARELLDYIWFENEWMRQRQIDQLLEEREEKAMLKKGLVKYEDEWIPKEEAEMREKGLVKYEDKWVTPREKENLENGRSLDNGEWLSKEEREKRAEGFYKVGDKYLSLEEANGARSTISEPWSFEHDNFVMESNHGYQFGRRLFVDAGFAYAEALQVLGAKPKEVEGRKPMLIACAGEEDYRSAGNVAQADFDAVKSSNYPQFCAFDPNDNLFRSVAVYALSDDYSLFMVRQAAAELALRAHPWAEELPRWIVEGIACMVARINDSSLYNWNVQGLVNQGGVLKMGDFLTTFVMSNQSIIQSGLICVYLTDASSTCSQAARDAWESVKLTAKGEGEGSFEKAVAKLEKALEKDGDNFSKWIESL